MATKKKTKKNSQALHETLDDILSKIIDEWYERVSGYYITQDDAGDPASDSIELKRFHDPKTGHRIKFNKPDLDFTYGLKSDWQDNNLAIEISVNNKVENFNYDDFRQQLFLHYAKAGETKVSGPARLGNVRFSDVFQLESGISQAFTVEKRKSKADIMRLTFRIPRSCAEELAADRDAAKQLVETYCVSPFRNIYAKVYRRNTA